ncbi:unnamed protein product [Pedinophyceae sp. YPF-701]|nr:unnamed protein product [Pedinophyceae sp. YPF-701]
MPAAEAGSKEAVESSGDAWKKAIDAVVPCCVVIKVTRTRAFDTESAGSTSGSGFVVDKERGIILTNRHIVSPGPIIAEGILQNHEEVQLTPLYYDPVHDFGFMKFDPATVRFQQIGDIPLDPGGAHIGQEIRVVGNDSGDKLSILSGTLARLDRDAPNYGKRKYNDFNTFYYQASSGTKGGSSGSPVIDVRGQAVAINAGGRSNTSSSAYYLPLPRVLRALEIIRAANRLPLAGPWHAATIPRGDLQTVFRYDGFEEVRRLGVRPETEAAVRQAMQGSPICNGMLVARFVVPGGVADGKLAAGDVLVRVNSVVVTSFDALEDILDDNVGGIVEVEIERSGEPKRLNIPVQDLHAVTPRRLLNVGGACLHALSYQQAIHFSCPIAGQVYVADPGYVLLGGPPKYALLRRINNTPVRTLEDVARVVRDVPVGKRLPVQYVMMDDRNRVRHKLVTWNVQWFGRPVMWQRDDALQRWHRHEVDAQPGAAWPDAPVVTRVVNSGAVNAVGVAVDGEASGDAGPAPGRARGKRDKVPDGTGMREGTQKRSKTGHAAQRPRGGSDAEMQAPAVGAPLEAQGARRGGRTGAESDGSDAASGDEAGGGGSDADAISGGGGEGGAPDAGGAAAPIPVATIGALPAPPDALDLDLLQSMVKLDVRIPSVALADGVHSKSFYGLGLIVSLSDSLGMVLTDRNTIPIASCDVMITFGAFPSETPALVRFLHPLHNFAIATFDPREVAEEARVQLRAATLSVKPFVRGERVVLAGLQGSSKVVRKDTKVLTTAGILQMRGAKAPRFRAVHEEAVMLEDDFGSRFAGVLCDHHACVRGLWGSYSDHSSAGNHEICAGMPAIVFVPWLAEVARSLRAGPAALEELSVRTLGAEVVPHSLSTAAQHGVPAAWVQRLASIDPERRQAMRVSSRLQGSHAHEVLEDGDWLLAVSNCPVVGCCGLQQLVCPVMGQVAAEQAEEAARVRSWRDSVSRLPRTLLDAVRGAMFARKSEVGERVEVTDLRRLTVCRDGKVFDIDVRLERESGGGTQRLVSWCGATIQDAHLPARMRAVSQEGVYISRYAHGSPAYRFGLAPTYWLLSVNGIDTPTIDALIEAVKGIKHGQYVPVKTMNLQGTPKVLTIKPDLVYWPTACLQADPHTGRWGLQAVTAATQ